MATQHPSSANAWMAVGIQYAVLMRALPVVQHDLASPLSVMRMGMTVLKRRMAPDGDLSCEQAVEYVAQLENQLLTLGEHVRRLRLWDLNIREQQPVRATVLQAMELAKPLLALRGVKLASPTGCAADSPETSAAHHPLLYITLGALYHLSERPGAPPAEVVVDMAATLVRVRAVGCVGPDAPVPLLPADAPSNLPIDALALACLAEHLGIRLRNTGGEVVIFLPLPDEVH